jgi:hypothetical protein
MDVLETRQGTVILFHTSEEYETAVWRNQMHYLRLRLCVKAESEGTHNTEDSLVLCLARHNSLSLTRSLT